MAATKGILSGCSTILERSLAHARTSIEQVHLQLCDKIHKARGEVVVEVILCQGFGDNCDILLCFSNWLRTHQLPVMKP